MRQSKCYLLMTFSCAQRSTKVIGYYILVAYVIKTIEKCRNTQVLNRYKLLKIKLNKIKN